MDLSARTAEWAAMVDAARPHLTVIVHVDEVERWEEDVASLGPWASNIEVKGIRDIAKGTAYVVNSKEMVLTMPFEWSKMAPCSESARPEGTEVPPTVDTLPMRVLPSA